jgi:hypothetical protein
MAALSMNRSPLACRAAPMRAAAIVVLFLIQARLLARDL